MTGTSKRAMHLPRETPVLLEGGEDAPLNTAPSGAPNARGK